MTEHEALKTPVAIFTYNRPKYTHKVLNSIVRCRRLDECSLYIFCDGPKNQTQMADVNASRKIVQSFVEKYPAEAIFREKNLGLSVSIVTAVTDLCQKYGKVIVIEDDLLVSPSFIDFFLQALDRYRDDERIFQISGYMFPVKIDEKVDAIFLPFTTTWGWATWERAWKYFRWFPDDYEVFFSNIHNKESFNLGNSYPYYSMLLDRFNGKNDSWGILWYYAVFKQKGFVLHPKIALVNVGGFDGTGTHCAKNNNEKIQEDPLWIFSERQQIFFPNQVLFSKKGYDEIKEFFHKQTSETFSSKLSKILHRLHCPKL